MKYSLKYNLINSSFINREVIKFFMEEDEYKGSGATNIKLSRDFPKIYKLIKREVREREWPKKALALIEDIDTVFISLTLSELWFSFSKLKKIQGISVSGGSKIVIRVAKDFSVTISGQGM